MDEVTHSPGDILRDRYRIEEIIGRGAYGIVYRASDMTVGGSLWAIKEIWEAHLYDEERREALELFRKEVSILGELNHTGIPRVLEFFSRDHHHYIVMEFIEGKTMEEVVARDKPDPATAVSWAIKICDILDYLHSLKPAPVIFRDLKPSNVMLTRRGRLMLIDFGIARFFNPMKVQDTSILGTPGFAPPEQYGKGQSDARSDIYSLGATLFNILTGHDLATFGFSAPPMSHYNSQVSPALEMIVAKCLDKDPARRFNSAAGLKRELQASLDNPDAPAASPQPHTVSSSPLPVPPWRLFDGGGPFALTLTVLVLYAAVIIESRGTSDFIPIIAFAAVAVTVLSFFWYIFKARFDYVMLIAFCAIAFYVLVPNFLRPRYTTLTPCKSNLKNMGTAMEMYSSDNLGRYPPALPYITPNYLKTLPTCPAARKMSYSYTRTTHPDCYTVWCDGYYHKELQVPGFPKYDAIQGLYD
jgi:serine/threonine-protein kinase